MSGTGIDIGCEFDGRVSDDAICGAGDDSERQRGDSESCVAGAGEGAGKEAGAYFASKAGLAELSIQAGGN